MVEAAGRPTHWLPSAEISCDLGVEVRRVLGDAGFGGRAPVIDKHIDVAASQAVAFTADTDLVTVTVGGNDIGYLPGLISAALIGWIHKLSLLGARLRRASAPAGHGDRLTRTADAISQVLSAVRERAPRARVVCVDYLTVASGARSEAGVR